MVLYISGLLIVYFTSIKLHTYTHLGMDNRHLNSTKANSIKKQGRERDKTLSAWRKIMNTFWDVINSENNALDELEENVICNSKNNARAKSDTTNSDESAADPICNTDFDKEVTDLLRRPYSSKTPHSPPNTEFSHDYADIKLCCQLENWDCGVACLQMALRWLREHDKISTTGTDGMDSRKLNHQELIERDWILQSIGVKSIWTIDLVMLLQRLIDKDELPANLSFLFCSTKLGVDASHGQLAYYTNAFQSDEFRVNKLFRQAKANGMPIKCYSRLELSQVIDVVSDKNKCIAIVLLDNQFLNERYSKLPRNGDKNNNDVNKNSRVYDAEQPISGEELCFDRSKSSSYSGHYVIMCGVSFNPIHIATAEKMDNIHTSIDYCVVIKNPARSNETDYITAELFTKAWRAEGTDEDIIFIAKNN
mmetsp:Transcript_30536/g.46852  ORF Transcript_30536/g.46852 Transcript_30536/m.46852 type:complete len:422 (-) Transcript_30536:169-1434(-)